MNKCGDCAYFAEQHGMDGQGECLCHNSFPFYRHNICRHFVSADEMKDAVKMVTDYLNRLTNERT